MYGWFLQGFLILVKGKNKLLNFVTTAKIAAAQQTQGIQRFFYSSTVKDGKLYHGTAWAVKDEKFFFFQTSAPVLSGYVLNYLCFPIFLCLLFKHFRISASFGQQLLMISLLYNPSLFHHIDLFRHAGCGQAMRYEKNRFIL